MSAGDVVTIERHGRSYLIHDPGGHIGAPIATGRPYEARLLDEIHSLGLTGSALDVGAHVGNHTLYLAAICGLSVVAVEADPDTYARLVENVELNPTLEIETHDLAAGRQTGWAHVERRTMRAVPAGNGPAPDGDWLVPMMALDDLLDETTDLSVVKVDVEGFESEVLAGLAGHLDAFGPVVYAECHTRTAHRRTDAVLAPLGYRCVGQVKMGSVMERWEVT